jgi:hypothetical protein
MNDLNEINNNMRPESMKIIPTGTITCAAGHAINIHHQPYAVLPTPCNDVEKQRRRRKLKYLYPFFH